MRGRNKLFVLFFTLLGSLLLALPIIGFAAYEYDKEYEYGNYLVLLLDAQKSGDVEWINKIDTNQKVPLKNTTENYMDSFGCHIKNTQNDGNNIEFVCNAANNSVKEVVKDRHYAIELVVREFKNEYDYNYFYQWGYDSFVIYYHKDALYVKFPGGGNDENNRPKYKISEAELQNCTISVSVASNKVNLYVNGKQGTTNTVNYTTPTSDVYYFMEIGSITANNGSDPTRGLNATIASVRIYDYELPETVVKDHFNLDKKWYFCNAEETNPTELSNNSVCGIDDCKDMNFDMWRTVSKIESAADIVNSELKISRSFYLKNKYAIGNGTLDTKEENGKSKPDLENSTRFMVTAKMKVTSYSSKTEFCGMVIDYSNKVFSLLDARRKEMYFTQTIEKTSPFSTGVGFNLLIENDIVKMRVFVAGDGNEKNTRYIDVPVGSKNEYHTYTIYRSYEMWPYENVCTYNGNTTIGLHNTKPSYIARFYADGQLKAVVGMDLDYLNSCYRTLQFRVGLFSVDDNGTLNIGARGKDANGSLCDFGDWTRENFYGENGAFSCESSDGDMNNNPENIGTPSGNVLIGLYCTSTDTNSNNVFVKDIGYMDYKDAAYSASLEVTKDMSVHFDTKPYYPEDMLPKIYFNRLGYTSSDETYSSIGAAEKNSETPKTNMHYDYKKLYEEKANSVDFKAAHGVSETAPKTEGGFIATVDGVFFRDIADTITYDVVDHNGIVIKTMKINLLTDYLIPLYKGEIGNLDEKQKNFIVDLIELGRQESIYTGYDQINADLKELSFEDKLPGCSRTSLEDIKKPDLLNPKVIKQEGITSFDNSFKSYNLVLKSYVALTVSIKLGSETELENCLTVYKGTTESNENKIDFSKHNAKYSLLSIKTEDGVATIEIPVSILDYGTIFRFVLTDKDGHEQRLDYSVNQYCYAKWETTKKGLNDYVKRLYHVGLLAKSYDQA